MGDQRVNAVIIGPGNIGTDLLYKILKRSKYMTVKLMVGIYPDSDGLQRARKLGVETSSDGIDSVVNKDIKIAFDATSADAHFKNAGVQIESRPSV